LISGYGLSKLFLLDIAVTNDEERWIHTLICMEIRRLYFLTRGDEYGFTVDGRGMEGKGRRICGIDQ
jgi:hypothetical protein